MKIGVLGSGDVGKALARGYLRHGHEVRIGTRQAAVDDLPVGPPAEVAAEADLVVLAVRGEVAVQVVTGIAEQVAGKVVVDTTNPLGAGEGGPRLTVGWTDSLGEQVQRAVPQARVVKAYNTVGNGLMVDPDLPGGPPTMFIAGDDEQAKTTVTDLLASTGWDVADLGGIEASRLLEPMCLAWVAHAGRTGSYHHAFKLLRS